MRIALETLGCKLNQAETEALARQLVQSGHTMVGSVDEADIYILNTCTVTQAADAKSRHLLRQARRQNANAFLVATGCYAHRIPEELEKLAGVQLVVGNDEKPALAFLIDEAACADGVCAIPGAGSNDGFVSRKRAFLKIQEGCSKRCSYCIVPAVRGEEKSQPAELIINEIKERAAAGINEVVVTGTEVGSYKFEGTDLSGLLERILAETDIARIRLSSLQPPDIKAELVRMWKNDRLCPHFHLSLQSGSDNVLKRMKRQYLTAEYRQAVGLIRSVVPEAAITTDVISGFPGETDDEFEESLSFYREMSFARIHVFSFSPRPGTEAAMLKQVSENVKKQRNQASLAVAEETAAEFMRSFIGTTMPVLWEHKSNNLWHGHTANYIAVYAESSGDLSNRLLTARLTGSCGDGMRGELVGL